MRVAPCFPENPCAVCGKACEQLQSIEAKLNDASFKSKRAVFDDVKKQTDAKLGAHFDVNDKTVSDFYATVACALVNAKAQDYDFEEALGKSFPVDDIRALHATLEQMYGDVEDEEDDDDTADVLADCQFTLAYGSKVLLHNTKLKLKRGHKYALLGGNDSGKTSLMRAIANEQVEGFPPASELRTVFVEADIIGVQELRNSRRGDLLSQLLAAARHVSSAPPRRALMKLG